MENRSLESVGAGNELICLRALLPTVTDRSQAGPWLLALGALTIGVAAVAAEVLRGRRDAPGQAGGDSSGEDERDGPRTNGRDGSGDGA
jgi:hypothetical protein